MKTENNNSAWLKWGLGIGAVTLIAIAARKRSANNTVVEILPAPTALQPANTLVDPLANMDWGWVTNAQQTTNSNTQTTTTQATAPATNIFSNPTGLTAMTSYSINP